MILGLIVVNVVLIFCYRRYLNKELKNEMNVQVSSAVSQYIALSNIPELEKQELTSV
jgi:hypothetical protein